MGRGWEVLGNQVHVGLGSNPRKISWLLIHCIGMLWCNQV